MSVKPEDIGKVINILDRVDIPYSIAGGYPRDLYFGETPKDCDFVLYGFEDIDELIGTYNMLAMVFDQDAVNPDEETEDKEYDDSRIFGVLKLADENIDLIFWLPQFQSEFEVIINFDFNLNQFVLGDHKPVYLGNACTYGALVQLRDSQVTEKRIERMNAKAREVCWAELDTANWLDKLEIEL